MNGVPVTEESQGGTDSANDIIITDDDPFGIHGESGLFPDTEELPFETSGPTVAEIRSEQFSYAEPSDDNPGDIIDGELVADDEKPLISPDRPRKEKPKPGPPTGDEWLDFFSRIALRFVTEWYVDNVAFRGIDEEDIAERDRSRLYLTKDERDTIAMPLAEYANKNPWTRKHGREIVSLASSFESLVILGTWFSRVNRIARKYRPQKRRPAKATVEHINGQNEYPQDPSGGRIPDGYGIFNPGGS